MDFFHKTNLTNFKKIVKNQYISVTHFETSEYLDCIFPSLDSKHSLPRFAKPTMREIIYLGDGVYCFDNQFAAYKYEIGAEHPRVVKVKYSDEFRLVDFDSPEVLLQLDDYLSDDFLQKIGEAVIDDEELIDRYKMLLAKVQIYLHNMDKEEEKFPAMFTIILFLLEHFGKIPTKRKADIVKKKFSEFKYPYFVIRNTEKIKGLGS